MRGKIFLMFSHCLMSRNTTWLKLPMSTSALEAKGQQISYPARQLKKLTWDYTSAGSSTSSFARTSTLIVTDYLFLEYIQTKITCFDFFRCCTTFHMDFNTSTNIDRANKNKRPSDSTSSSKKYFSDFPNVVSLLKSKLAQFVNENSNAFNSLHLIHRCCQGLC
jgi:hypothetical protein